MVHNIGNYTNKNYLLYFAKTDIVNDIKWNASGNIITADMIISSIFIRLNFLQTYLGSYNYITIELAKFFVILTNY